MLAHPVHSDGLLNDSFSSFWVLLQSFTGYYPFSLKHILYDLCGKEHLLIDQQCFSLVVS